MKNRRHVFWVACLLMSGIACSRQADTFRMEALARTLHQANEVNAQRGALAFRHMEDKWLDEMSRAKANLWLPQAKGVKEVSDQAITWLDSLRQQLTAHHRLLKEVNHPKQGSPFDVYLRYYAYKQRLLNQLDTCIAPDNPKLIENLAKAYHALSRSFSLTGGNDELDGWEEIAKPVQREHWIRKHFANTSPEAAILMLDKLKGEIAEMTVNMLEFMNYYAAANFCGYYKETGIVYTPISSVKPKQHLTINLGVGGYARETHPRIYIDNTLLLPQYEAAFDWVMIATGHPGLHTIPVRLEYEQFGAVRVIHDSISYSITP